MKVHFDPGALLRLVLLAGVSIGLAFLVGLLRDGSLSLSAVLTAGLIFCGVWLLILFIRLPFYSFVGMYRSAERLTSASLAIAEEEPEGKEYLFFQHSFFAYHLGNFSEAVHTLDKIDPANVPDSLCAMVDLHRAIFLEALFRSREAEEILQNYDMDDYAGKALSLWQAYLANAKAGLGLDLDMALCLAETAFARNPSAVIATIMGHVLWRIEQYDAASSWFAYALRRMPRKERYFKSYTFFLQGRLLRELGKQEGASEAFERALALAPSQECHDLYLKNWESGSRRQSPRSGEARSV